MFCYELSCSGRLDAHPIWHHNLLYFANNIRPGIGGGLCRLPQIPIDRGQIGCHVGTGNDTAGSYKNGLLQMAVARGFAPEEAESFENIDAIDPQEGAKST